MGWLKKNWRNVTNAICAGAGAISYYVPAVLPVVGVCAIVVPVINSSPDILSGLKNLITALGPKPPAK